MGADIDVSQLLHVSMRGRVAYAIICLEEAILQLAQEPDEWAWLLRRLWTYTSARRLDDWQDEAVEVTSNVILHYEQYPDKSFDYLTEAEVSTLRVLYEASDPTLSRLVDLVYEIGTLELFGGLEGGAPESLQGLGAVVSLLRDKGIPGPSVALVADKSFTEEHGWGTPFDADELRRIGKRGC